MLIWSVMSAVLGCCGAGAWMVSLCRRGVPWRPQWYWLLGLAALFPAWLLAFVGLLGPVSGQSGISPLPPIALFSSGAALLGVVLTDAAVRRWHETGRAYRPVIYWIWGLVALLPGWGLALLGLLQK